MSASEIFVWSVALLCMVSAVQDCGDGYITIHIKEDCTNSTCIGKCRDKDTCCLEKCFAGNQPTSQETEGCVDAPGTLGSCSIFENQTECLSRNVNKTFEICWKHTIYSISSHPISGSIIGFNPVNCPCEYGQTRKAGTCSFPQCLNNLNSSVCELKEDRVLNTEVCCLSEDIFPQENDCDDNEKLDRSVHQSLNVSTLALCQEVCQGGTCKMPDPSRLPACCKRKTKIARGQDDDGLHGGIIAVIVVVIVVLTLAGAFGVFYFYRVKQEANHMKSNRSSDKTSIEMTGSDEIVGPERAWKGDFATYHVMTTNGNVVSEVPDSYQVPDKYDHVSASDFNLSINSIERLQNGNAHVYDNRTNIDEDEKIDDGYSYQS